ncbi:FAD/NAD-P-binding domain-containing protein [Hygrophoropsis aurantiaca]|uniref:FAD/NAD-P-binding domain-containing protein n=1 Tax=Hygrophoropsis aurantiaca TaxID=72124 RepID=A0ACB8AH33_9AGAM|nr:FAD/NAD-P-binding domain-containing protein [Hygrophoropsis aurantiaca]
MPTDNYFDAIVLGTGLTESTIAAAISKAGFKVAHLDTNSYYGGHEASLSLDELAQWADVHSRPDLTAQSNNFSSVTRSETVPPHSRQYSVSLSPSVIPAVGPFISSLVASGVSRYGSFKLLERVAIFDGTQIKSVPQSKEDIFQDKTLTLIYKRRLMRFLMFASGEFELSNELAEKPDVPFFDFLISTFSLSDEIATVITFAMAYCNFKTDLTLPALRRVRKLLKSVGRYGPSSFLVGYYGGSGEIAQGFCRTSAVNRGVYILGKNIATISQNNGEESELSRTYKYTVELDDFPETLYSRCLISSPYHLSAHLDSITTVSHSTPTSGSTQPVAFAKCIAIIDKPISFKSSEHVSAESDENSSSTSGISEPDTAIIVFPPGSLASGSSNSSAHVLTTGPGTMTAPAGKCIFLNHLTEMLSDSIVAGIIYISIPLSSLVDSSPEPLIKPYLDTVLSMASSKDRKTEPLFLVHYVQHISSPEPSVTPANTSPSLFVTPLLHPDLTQSCDEAAVAAETIFWNAIRSLESSREGSERPPDTNVEDINTVESFWPSVGPSDDDESEDGW